MAPDRNGALSRVLLRPWQLAAARRVKLIPIVMQASIVSIHTGTALI
jgi:hypothetical protein